MAAEVIRQRFTLCVVAGLRVDKATLGEEERGSRPAIELLHWSIELTRAAHRERPLKGLCCARHFPAFRQRNKAPVVTISAAFYDVLPLLLNIRVPLPMSQSPHSFTVRRC